MTVLPDGGCLYSMLPVAQALRRAGHDVMFCSSATLRTAVDSHGYAFTAVGPEWRTADPHSLAIMLRHAGSTDLTRLTGSAPLAWIPWASEYLCFEMPRQTAPDIVDVVCRWSADILVRDAVDFSGYAAAELTGLPHVSVATTADSVIDIGSLVTEPLGRLRDSIGLEPDRETATLYPYLHLSLTPPEFEDPNARLPSTVRFLEYKGVVRPGDVVPDWVLGLSDVPLVLVNLGMVFHAVPGLLRTIVDAVARLPVEVIVAAGAQHAADTLRDVPENVHVATWLPYALLMPKCSVFITHGGMSSLREALKCAVPAVVLPVFADQLYTAHRCAALGLAPVVWPNERDSEKIEAATWGALADRSYKQHATWIAAAMESLPPVDNAVRLVERVVTQRTLPKHAT